MRWFLAGGSAAAPDWLAASSKSAQALATAAAAACSASAAAAAATVATSVVEASEGRACLRVRGFRMPHEIGTRASSTVAAFNPGLDCLCCCAAAAAADGVSALLTWLDCLRPLSKGDTPTSASEIVTLGDLTLARGWGCWCRCMPGSAP